MPRLRQSFPSWPPAPLSHRRLNPPCGLHCSSLKLMGGLGWQNSKSLSSSTSCLRLHGFTTNIKDTSQLGAHLSGSAPSEPESQQHDVAKLQWLSNSTHITKPSQTHHRTHSLLLPPTPTPTTPTMSRASKLTLLGTSIFAASTVVFVHWAQKAEQEVR